MWRISIFLKKKKVTAGIVFNKQVTTTTSNWDFYLFFTHSNIVKDRSIAYFILLIKHCIFFYEHIASLLSLVKRKIESVPLK